MIIHLGNLSIQTDTITYIAHSGDGSVTIFFVGGEKLDLKAETANMFFKQLDYSNADPD